MIEPQPLDGKITTIKLNYTNMFEKKDVASAVLEAQKNKRHYWLCNECKVLWPKPMPNICSCGNDMTSNATKRYVIFDYEVDDAFPGVSEDNYDNV